MLSTRKPVSPRPAIGVEGNNQASNRGGAKQ
jgi:hypothetical protein